MGKGRISRLIAGAIISVLIVASFIGCNYKVASSNLASSEDNICSITEIKTKLTNAKLEGTEAPVDGTVLTTTLTFTPPPSGHGNPAVNGGPDWSLEPIIFDYLCGYSSQPEKTFKPSLLESYDFKDKLLTLKLKEGLKWSDGSPMTADDLLCTIYIDMVINKIAYYAESVVKVNNKTIQIKYNTESPLILDYILKTPLKYSKKEYGKYSEKYKKAFETMRTTKEDGNYIFTKEGEGYISNIVEEFNNYLPDIKTIMCSGPYVVKTITSSEMILERNPNYRIPMKIEKIKAIRPTSTESTAVAVMNKEYDAEGMGLGKEMAKKVAETNRDTIRQMIIPEYSQLALCFNLKKTPTDNINIRKAIAYVIDKAAIAPISEPGMKVGKR